MRTSHGWGRFLTVMTIGVLAAAATGCGQQQLEERNMALQKQLESALSQNADLQAQNDTLKAQNDSLTSDLDRARAMAAAARGGPATPAALVKGGRTKPEFGDGIETSMVGETLTVTLPEAIVFASGSAELKADAKRHIDKIIAVLNKDYAGDRIRVEGHTDDQPIVKSKKLWQDNWDLACNRSMSVVRYMAGKGIDPKRIYAAGYGPYKPVASNGTAAGRSKNRRVAIVVYPQRGGS